MSTDIQQSTDQDTIVEQTTEYMILYKYYAWIHGHLDHGENSAARQIVHSFNDQICAIYANEGINNPNCNRLIDIMRRGLDIVADKARDEYMHLLTKVYCEEEDMRRIITQVISE